MFGPPLTHKREAGDGLFDADDEEDEEGGEGNGKGKGKAKQKKRAKTILTAAGAGGGGVAEGGAKEKAKGKGPRAVSSTVFEGGEQLSWVHIILRLLYIWCDGSYWSTTSRFTIYLIHHVPPPRFSPPPPPKHTKTSTPTQMNLNPGDFDPEALAAEYATSGADGAGGGGGTAALGKTMHAQVCGWVDVVGWLVLFVCVYVYGSVFGAPLPLPPWTDRPTDDI